MASYHRSNQSISSNNLQSPPSQNMKQQRRMTSPAMSSHGSLNLPDRGRQPSPRPPSPLRNAFTFDSSTGIDPNEDSEGSDGEADEAGKWERSPSPASSVSHLAASFVQRMNSFVGNVAPRSPGGMPTDAELEADAERERDRSRREAEAILTREARQRRLVEDRVLAMIDNAKGLPPPPSRSQTTPSPSSSQKEGTSWWHAAKTKLTPTKDKDPPTPAQQIILEAKAREKEKKNNKGKEKEGSANSQDVFNDPAVMNLNIPVAPPQRKPVPVSPSSPTPSRPSLSSMPPNLSPSPMRQSDSISTSPSREAPPVYAQFNAQGTLDVHGTLLMIAKRFEKLEKWTVGHVRALEDRMNDVERWLVDKEKEKEVETASTKEHTSLQHTDSPDVQQELNVIRDEVSELQGRVGELGREMAKLAAAPSNLSSGPKSQPVTVISAASTVLLPELTGTSTLSEIAGTPWHPRLSSTTASESTSPPLTSMKTPSRTRLPYPAGDYTSPPDTFSPTSSPPASINSHKHTRPLSIAGLPSSSYSSAPLSLTGGISRPRSPPTSPESVTAKAPPATARGISPTPPGKPDGGLPLPKYSTSQRQTSVSPTPRKRYTVALGGPIVAPADLQSNVAEPPRRVGTPKSFTKPQPFGETGFFASSSATMDNGGEDDVNDGGETIGKSAAARLSRNLPSSHSTSSLNSVGGREEHTYKGGGDYKSANEPSPSSNRRLRAQSAYGFSSIPGVPQTPVSTTSATAPLKVRVRARSTDRLNASGSGDGAGATSVVGGPGKFVDPLLLRRQEATNGTKPIVMPKPIGKVPIGQLVAFFDGDKKERS